MAFTDLDMFSENFMAEPAGSLDFHGPTDTGIFSAARKMNQAALGNFFLNTANNLIGKAFGEEEYLQPKELQNLGLYSIKGGRKIPADKPMTRKQAEYRIAAQELEQAYEEAVMLSGKGPLKTFGWTIAGGIAGGLFDPASWGLGIATAGVVNPLVSRVPYIMKNLQSANRATRIAWRAGTIGAVEGGVNIATGQQLSRSLDRDYTSTEVVIDGMIGVILGSVPYNLPKRKRIEPIEDSVVPEVETPAHPNPSEFKDITDQLQDSAKALEAGKPEVAVEAVQQSIFDNYTEGSILDYVENNTELKNTFEKDIINEVLDGRFLHEKIDEQLSFFPKSPKNEQLSFFPKSHKEEIQNIVDLVNTKKAKLAEAYSQQSIFDYINQDSTTQQSLFEINDELLKSPAVRAKNAEKFFEVEETPLLPFIEDELVGSPNTFPYLTPEEKALKDEFVNYRRARKGGSKKKLSKRLTKKEKELLNKFRKARSKSKAEYYKNFPTMFKAVEERRLKPTAKELEAVKNKLFDSKVNKLTEKMRKAENAMVELKRKLADERVSAGSKKVASNHLKKHKRNLSRYKKELKSLETAKNDFAILSGAQRFEPISWLTHLRNKHPTEPARIENIIKNDPSLTDKQKQIMIEDGYMNAMGEITIKQLKRTIKEQEKRLAELLKEEITFTETLKDLDPFSQQYEKGLEYLILNREERLVIHEALYEAYLHIERNTLAKRLNDFSDEVSTEISYALTDPNFYSLALQGSLGFFRDTFKDLNPEWAVVMDIIPSISTLFSPAMFDEGKIETRPVKVLERYKGLLEKRRARLFKKSDKTEEETKEFQKVAVNINKIQFYLDKMKPIKRESASTSWDALTERHDSILEFTHDILHRYTDFIRDAVDDVVSFIPKDKEIDAGRIFENKVNEEFRQIQSKLKEANRFKYEDHMGNLYDKWISKGKMSYIEASIIWMGEHQHTFDNVELTAEYFKNIKNKGMKENVFGMIEGHYLAEAQNNRDLFLKFYDRFKDVGDFLGKPLGVPTERKPIGMLKEAWKYSDKNLIKGISAILEMFRRKDEDIQPHSKRIVGEPSATFETLMDYDGLPYEKMTDYTMDLLYRLTNFYKFLFEGNGEEAMKALDTYNDRVNEMVTNYLGIAERIEEAYKERKMFRLEDDEGLIDIDKYRDMSYNLAFLKRFENIFPVYDELPDFLKKNIPPFERETGFKTIPKSVLRGDKRFKFNDEFLHSLKELLVDQIPLSKALIKTPEKLPSIIGDEAYNKVLKKLIPSQRDMAEALYLETKQLKALLAMPLKERGDYLFANSWYQKEIPKIGEYDELVSFFANTLNPFTKDFENIRLNPLYFHRLSIVDESGGFNKLDLYAAFNGLYLTTEYVEIKQKKRDPSYLKNFIKVRGRVSEDFHIPLHGVVINTKLRDLYRKINPKGLVLDKNNKDYHIFPDYDKFNNLSLKALYKEPATKAGLFMREVDLETREPRDLTKKLKNLVLPPNARMKDFDNVFNQRMKIISQLTKAHEDISMREALKDLLTLTHSKDQSHSVSLPHEMNLVKDEAGVFVIDKDNFKLDILEGKPFSSYLQLSTMNLLFGIPREMLFKNGEFTSLFKRTKARMLDLSERELEHMALYGSYEHSMEFLEELASTPDPDLWKIVVGAETKAFQTGDDFYKILKEALPLDYIYLAGYFEP